MNCHGCARDDETRWRVWVLMLRLYLLPFMQTWSFLSHVFPWHLTEFCWLLVCKIGLMYNVLKRSGFWETVLKVSFPRERRQTMNHKNWQAYVVIASALTIIFLPHSDATLHRETLFVLTICANCRERVLNQRYGRSIASDEPIQGNTLLFLPSFVNDELQSSITTVFVKGTMFLWR